MKKFLLLPLLASLVLSSCEKVLEVDEYEAQRLVVVNAVPSNGQQLFVNLSYSHFFLDTLAAHPIDGATMSVSVNGMRYMPSAVKGCNYFFPCIMSDGDVLSLEASVKGTTITAQTVVPPMPALNNLTAQVDTSTAFTFCRIAVDLADHGGMP
ncbi:MAG: DUF4249 family protein [Bacteroidales bacterium]|nr:DUF4249 family protein [Bacteroidales bacterium]